MKLFKHTLIYAASAALLLSGTACSDFLDKAPENKVPEESIDYTNLANMYQPVSGVYAKVRTGGLHWISLAAFLIRDDDVWSGRHDDQADLVKMGEKFLYSNGWWGFNETWNQHYGIVRFANTALEDLEGFKANITSDADMQRYNTYTGEVRFLRAYAYYRLTQVFGDVTILYDNMQTDMTRTKRDVVYQYMLQEDLEYAMKNLPEVHPANAEHKGAVTAYTAAALAAKVNLQMNNYSEVERLTDYIINGGKFDLYDDYYKLFKTDGMLCCESMFEAQITNFGIGSGDEIRPGEFYVFQALPTAASFQAGDSSAIATSLSNGLKTAARLSVRLQRSSKAARPLRAATSSQAATQARPTPTAGTERHICLPTRLRKAVATARATISVSSAMPTYC